MRFIDLTGKKFGRLTVLSLNKKGGHPMWNCVCDCGKHKVVYGGHLRYGRIISCGCASIERISNLNKTHGQSKTRLYNIWAGIKSRCYDKNCSSFINYGSRGIKMCEEWKNNFTSFRDWSLSHGYLENLSIDRIDNNGDYEPNNCRWVDNFTQSNNTRKTIIIEYGDKKYSAKQLANFLNINYKKFIYGFHKFNDIEKSVEYAKKYKKRRI